MSATTIRVLLKNGEYVEVKQATPETKHVRTRTSNFLQKAMSVYESCNRAETGELVTPAVFREVVHCATPFHTNKAGTVDVAELKKDVPIEASKDEECGYWQAKAGPAPRFEQNEMEDVLDVPPAVMNTIRATNDHNLIAHYLYAFIDFWSFILRHWLIWLACIFCYGYLCILQPVLIVAESSKLCRILTELDPRAIFRPDITADEFEAFLNGHFTLATLKSLCVWTRTDEWDDYELPPDDWIVVIGILRIVRYGPLPHHVALFIPKADPYSHYHIKSLAREQIEVNRVIRLIVSFCKIVIETEPALPNDSSREATLVKLRLSIMKQLARRGYLAELQAAKNELLTAQRAHLGPMNVAATARLKEAAEDSTNDDTNKAAAVR